VVIWVALSAAWLYSAYIMQTVTISLSQILSNLTSSWIDIIQDCDSKAEHERQLNEFTSDLRDLLSFSDVTVVNALRRLFSQGFTMMMLGHDHFTELEVLSKAEEEHCVVVKDGTKVLCILCQSELVW